MFAAKMLSHPVNYALPIFISALLMNPLISEYGELLRPWCDENQNAISFPGFVDLQPLKLCPSRA